MIIGHADFVQHNICNSHFVVAVVWPQRIRMAAESETFQIGRWAAGMVVCTECMGCMGVCALLFQEALMDTLALRRRCYVSNLAWKTSWQGAWLVESRRVADRSI